MIRQDNALEGAVVVDIRDLAALIEVALLVGQVAKKLLLLVRLVVEIDETRANVEIVEIKGHRNPQWDPQNLDRVLSLGNPSMNEGANSARTIDPRSTVCSSTWPLVRSIRSSAPATPT